MINDVSFILIVHLYISYFVKYLFKSFTHFLFSCLLITELQKFICVYTCMFICIHICLYVRVCVPPLLHRKGDTLQMEISLINIKFLLCNGNFWFSELFLCLMFLNNQPKIVLMPKMPILGWHILPFKGLTVEC